jgi:hypothetical protein
VNPFSNCGGYAGCSYNHAGNLSRLASTYYYLNLAFDAFFPCLLCFKEPCEKASPMQCACFGVVECASSVEGGSFVHSPTVCQVSHVIMFQGVSIVAVEMQGRFVS